MFVLKKWAFYIQQIHKFYYFIAINPLALTTQYFIWIDQTDKNMFEYKMDSS